MHLTHAPLSLPPQSQVHSAASDAFVNFPNSYSGKFATVAFLQRDIVDELYCLINGGNTFYTYTLVDQIIPFLQQQVIVMTIIRLALALLAL